MIQGLRNFLEKEIEPLDYVEAIFPGRLRELREQVQVLRSVLSMLQRQE